VLRLNRGKWSGQTWVARLHCCDNPLCGCADVDFYCCLADQGNSAERPEVLHFALDPMRRAIARHTGGNRHPDSEELAQAVAAEFGEVEWRLACHFLVFTNRETTRKMDVNERPAPSSPELMTDDGSLVAFADPFPFADCFEFDVNGEHWALNDLYFVMPDCGCREVVLDSRHLVRSSDGSHIAKQPLRATRYDDQRKAVRAEHEPAAGEPSREELVRAARKAHPSLDREVKRRHGQLKTLYLRALLNANEQASPRANPVVMTKAKIGRNDPCPPISRVAGESRS
jgi:hypothetical protein